MKLINSDTTKNELAQPPENQYEAQQAFYTPSERYRKVLDILDKDITLSNLGDTERRELVLLVRLILNAIEYEELQGWEAGAISNYWIQRAALSVTSSRAKNGFTALLSKTTIEDIKQKVEETRKEPPKPNIVSRMIPGVG